MMKILPHDNETEVALLGCMMNDPKGTRAKIQPIVRAEDFYSDKHRVIFGGILDIDAPDVNHLEAALQKQGSFQKAGGHEYIRKLIAVSLTSVGVGFYGKRVRELSDRRTMAVTGQKLFQDACDLTRELPGITSELKATIRAIERDQQPDHKEARTVLDRVLQDIENRSKAGNHAVGILSGYNAIDTHLLGFEPKTLTYHRQTFHWQNSHSFEYR